ncbi:manganese catalase family protein [Sporolituus thermophilus]|uniref:Manganese containing catalase n=1 Tax=Sporolituus thermophilus DSM 23256 TaxID=1123285 RepID=A0A1G7MHK9_9FIRM|nr:manganese catalase family protein [Sporolituus thermophilus]SDF61096.1 Manganese containing catalase [Sporolituus thermophilus DSM 23256]
MWIYEKKLEHPVKVCRPDVKFAKMVIAQYGGPDGELSASLRYLNQRYSMPTSQAKALLTDIGKEVLEILN